MISLLAALALALELSAPTPAKAPRARAASAGAPAAELDVSTYPPEQQARFALVREKCAKCHSLEVALRAPPTDFVWNRHQHRPGLAISPAQARDVLEFLRFHAEQRAGR